MPHLPPHLLLLAALAAPAAGQTPSAWDRLTPVEPGRSDVSGLAVEARVQPLNLRWDQNFESLYRGTNAAGQTFFARRDAGVTAVFDRSAYVSWRGEDIPVVPPGTTFIIGEPAPGLAGSLLGRRLGLGPIAPSREPRDPSNGLRQDTRLSDEIFPDRVVFEGRDAAAADPAPHAERSTVRRGTAGLLRDAAQREKRAE